MGLLLNGSSKLGGTGTAPLIRIPLTPLEPFGMALKLTPKLGLSKAVGELAPLSPDCDSLLEFSPHLLVPIPG